MTNNLEADNSTEVVELSPNFKIPLFLIVTAGILSLISWWLAGAIAVLGLFLTIQTFLIKLQFTEKALNVLRSGSTIRSFPYSDWLNWEIFWRPRADLVLFQRS